MDNNRHFDIKRLRSIPISKVAERWGLPTEESGQSPSDPLPLARRQTPLPHPP
ncbi:MAG: hypothetical protein IJP75_01555 [Bacteroidaceae bacterium]|nr:hypothetical protein [Bacteroidaceae bacterium]